MDMVSIRQSHLSGVFYWFAHLRNRQELVTLFKMTTYLLITHDNLGSESIFSGRIVPGKGSRLNIVKSS